MHIIKLRAAWQRTIGSNISRVSLPDEDNNESSPVIYLRPFNAPTGIDAETHVDLVIEKWRGLLTLRFDATPVILSQRFSEKPLILPLKGRLVGQHFIEIVLDSDGDSMIGLDGICYLAIQ